MRVDSATELRIQGNVVFQLDPGSALENNGLIVLESDAVLQEADGAPIFGNGTERFDRTYATPMNGIDAGGLGLRLTTPGAPGDVLLVRGHISRTDTAGRSSVARWYRVLVQQSTGQDATVEFAVDNTELNAIPPANLVLHANSGGDSLWMPFTGAVDIPDLTVTADVPDTLGTFTLFDGPVSISVIERPAALGYGLFPTHTDGPVQVVIPDGHVVRSMELVDSKGGRLPLAYSNLGSGTHHLDLGSIASGAYWMVLDARIALPLIRQ